jgi:hypothetical protein
MGRKLTPLEREAVMRGDTEESRKRREKHNSSGATRAAREGQKWEDATRERPWRRSW